MTESPPVATVPYSANGNSSQQLNKRTHWVHPLTATVNTVNPLVLQSTDDDGPTVPTNATVEAVPMVAVPQPSQRDQHVAVVQSPPEALTNIADDTAAIVATLNEQSAQQ
jgi:hypothetical protein